MSAPALRVLATLLALLAACAHEPPAKRVIWITCDTLRADRLGMYGYGRGTSRRLDAFAREGVVFDEAYASAPMTLPSVSSMLTGRLPHEVGVDNDNHRHMPPEALTIAELLAGRGIATAAVVSNPVLRRPPDWMAGAGVAQGFEHYDDAMLEPVHNREQFERHAPATTDAAIAWLARRAALEPFFLWVHYQDPHGPYTAPADLVRAFAPLSSGEPELPLGASRFGLGQIPDYQALDGERRPEVYRARYDAEIAFFDREVGRLFDWLRAHGMYDDALIVFTSDHGESLGEHDYWFCHGENVYREVVRVPLVVRLPRGAAVPHDVENGGWRRSSHPAGHVDLWATTAEALGVDPGPSRGASLLAERDPGELLYAQHLWAEVDRPSWEAWSDGRWRVLHRLGAAELELYDVTADPRETADLAAAQRDVVQGFQYRIARRLAQVELPRLRGVDQTHLDPEQRRALEKLGYTGGGAGEDPRGDPPKTRDGSR